MKKLILFFMFFLSLTLLHAQKEFGRNEPCYFDQLIKNNPEIKERINSFDEFLLKQEDITLVNKSGQNLPQITIPVVVYIVHKSSDPIGSGSNISDAQVISQIDAMNTYFQAYNIRFCLATLAGNANINVGLGGGVQNTPGIIHKSNSSLSDHDANTEQQSLINATSNTYVSRDNYLRIWVVNSINGLGNNVLGYSMFPNSSVIFDGIVVRYDVFGDNSNCNNCYNLLENYDKGKTLIHEFGHYAGLYHTFEGSCNSQNKPCNEHGDKVCDTPPTAAPNFICVSTDSCLQDSEQDDVSNYMDYGNDNCSDHFSQGQIERIINVLANYRNNLFSTSNLIYTGICGYENLVSADFDADTFSPCIGQQIQFTAIQQNATSYFWDFGDGTTSTVANPIHNYGSENIYTISLIVNGNTATYNRIYVTDCEPIQSSEGNWYFSSSNMINFSSGVPIVVTIPTTNFSTEGAAIQNDNNGNLLFYTNGIRIWNNNHNVINNNSLLFGDFSSLKGVAIIPNPANNNQYYIFTKAKQGESNGFRFSLISVDDSNITLITINQPINVPSFNLGNNGALISNESIGVSQHCNGYWVFTTAFKNNNEYMLTFNLNVNGLVFVDEFLIGPFLTGGNFVNYCTSIEVSPNGNYICLSRVTNSMTNLLTFDKVNGIITNNYEFSIPNSSGVYDTQFSPNSNVIYLTNVNTSSLYYYNLISNFTNLINQFDTQVAGIQLGPDNKIYISKFSKRKLAAINNPDELSLNDNLILCNFTEFAGPNLHTELEFALPNMIDAKINTSFDDTISYYPENCLTYHFFPNACGESFNWNFGDPSSGSSNIFVGSVATHTFSGEGTYTVTLRDNYNVIINTLIVNIGITPPTIVGSTSACLETINTTNNSIELENGYHVSWAITSGSGVIGLNNQSDVTIEWSSLPGTITATITNHLGCSYIVNTTIQSHCENNCPDNLIFSSAESSTLITYNTSNFIETNTNYLVNSASDITLKAGNFIVIKPESQINSGSQFFARIENCDGSQTGKMSNTFVKTPKNSKPKPFSKNNTSSDILESFEISGLIIYPNPSKGLVNIITSLNAELQVNIFDMLGKEVANAKVSNNTLDVSYLTSGVYIIKINEEGKTATRKLVIE